ncbi:ferritin-like domain-containing protein [Janthinobacterium agaricidamnosum]|uniref:Ferritin-like domain protein n=1 Tax=Janthinobacterium agaricidamnosum NBRC 102515 = DSM 9628 TaxID=1349767 RepID=W0VB41_9BURK|nr:ferritin-like domain-containing protein [Janthinobacterium agaricidamnosum]CDG84472.1 putative uncharacterized protein [Janthinobacterium agaricidamnosum NBRC 102515 = DSM 9628]
MTSSDAAGINRTGIHMSPLDSRAMQHADGAAGQAYFNDAGSSALRTGYIVGADRLGSVPLPVARRAAAQAGGRPDGTPLVKDHRQGGRQAGRQANRQDMLLDKLGERLAFERTATRLYDALITKCVAMSDSSIGMTVEDLRDIRDDEARHFLTAARAIESLGGDATAQTPSADMVGLEAMGLVQVLADPRTTIAQSLHAILTAELADHVGWEALIALASEHGQMDMINDFSVALDEELGHLLLVQGWYEVAIGLPSAAAPNSDALPALAPD